MTTLRIAAQQALEALEADCGGRCNAEYNPCWQRQMAEALKAALAEEALQRLTDVQQEIEAALAEPVQELPWLRAIDEAMIDHHVGVADPADDYETAKRKLNNLLCHAQDIGAHFAKQAEPVQEPRATMTVREDMGVDFKFSHAHTLHPGQKFYLYTAPPQRKPLTKESLLHIYNQLPNWGMDMDSLPQGLEKFARAIERAHKIGGEG